MNALFAESIYSHQYTDLNGNTVSMSQYQGKKILLVNIAMQLTYHAAFPMAARMGVKDSTGNTHPLYSWLQHKSANGVMDVHISKDFQKILIDNNGSVIGFFGSRVLPMSNTIQNAIKNN
jgi:glutathione peroxidase-family protein